MGEREVHTVIAACHRLGKTSLSLRSPLPPTSLPDGKLTKRILQKSPDLFTYLLLFYLFLIVSVPFTTPPQKQLHRHRSGGDTLRCRTGNKLV